MSLQKLLAENMIRFGVKNLNEQLRKTLLNEGLTPGQFVANYKGPLEIEVGATNGPAALKKIQPYEKGFKRGGAIIALAVGLANLIKKDKKLSKATGNAATNDTLYNALTTNTNFYDNEWSSLIDSAGSFTVESTEVPVYPMPGKPQYVATLGRITTSGDGFTAIDTEKQSGVAYPNIITYFNSFNITNVLEGDFTQYRLSDMVDTNNHINFMTTSPASNTVIVYTATAKKPGAADKEINTTQQGATLPIPKVYDVNFAQSVATVPPNDAEVARAIKDAIAMFPDGNISNLSVVSSASPEYGAIKNVPGWEKSYPKGITGTGNPGTGTDDASKNIQLAYDRGVNFVAAINAGLVAQGKPEMVNTSINWQISDKGGSPNSLGRFSNVNWATAGTPGTTVNKLVDTGKTGDVTSGKETYTIFQHVFTCVS